MSPFVFEAGKDLTEYLRNVAVKESSTDAREVAMRYTTDVLTSCTYGIHAHCFHSEKSEFREIAKKLFNEASISRKLHMAAYFFAPFLVKLFRLKFLDPIAGSQLKDIFTAIVAERKKTKLFVGDFVDILIEHINKSGDELDMEVAAAQAINFFMAGFETTGSTITYALYELCLHPQIQQRVREEIQTVIKPHEPVTWDTFSLMNYMEMVIKETIRKHPVLSFLARDCNKPYKIPEIDVTIEKGTPVYISLLGLHFDPEYFPNPSQFDPERFTDENIAKMPDLCYLSFGVGPRKCVGSRLGLLIVKVALASILTEFEILPASNTVIPLVYDSKGFVLTPKNGMNLKFKHVS